MNKKKLKVDIILPNYNSSQFIEETIESIIRQSFKNWRLIVIDDCSDIETRKILKKYTKFKKIKNFWLKKKSRRWLL